MGFSKRDQSLVDIQKVNVVSGRSERLKVGRLDIQDWYTDRRGIPRIGQGLKHTNKAEEEWTLLIKDSEGETWRSADEYEGLDADNAIFGFTEDPNELIVGMYAGKDTLGLYIYDLKTKAIVRKLFHHDEYDAAGIVVSADEKHVVGASYIADSREVALFDEYDSLLGEMRAKYKDFTVSYVDQSQAGEKILFKVSGGSEPGSLMLVDAESKEPAFIAAYNPDLPGVDMGTVHPIKYPARDNVSIPGYLTLPPSITSQSEFQNLPFVVLPHGGPYARSSASFDYFAQFFATRGFGVLQMNFRGSAGYGQAYEDSGRENWQVMQEDVTDGTRWLIEKGYADPNKICIVGWSFGGYAALMGAIEHDELYACAVSMAGVTDLGDLVKDLEKYRFGKLSASNFVLKGFDSKGDLKASSPVHRAQELKVPLLLAHGRLDQRVHFDQFTRMKAALRKNPVKVEYVEFKNEDHFLSNQENRQEFFEKLDRFLGDTMGKR